MTMSNNAERKAPDLPVNDHVADLGIYLYSSAERDLDIPVRMILYVLFQMSDKRRAGGGCSYRAAVTIICALLYL